MEMMNELEQGGQLKIKIIISVQQWLDIGGSSVASPFERPSDSFTIQISGVSCNFLPSAGSSPFMSKISSACDNKRSYL